MPLMPIVRFNYRWFSIALMFAFIASITIPAVGRAEESAEKGLKKEDVKKEQKPELDKNFAALFEERNYSPSDAEQEGVGYKLFVPTIKQGEKYPLIVWLNGSGVDDDENTQIEQQQVLKSTIFQNPKRLNKYRFFSHTSITEGYQKSEGYRYLAERSEC